MATTEPSPVDGLRDRIDKATRGEPIALSGGKADAVTDAVIEVLREEMAVAWQDWAQRGSALRHCTVPGCLREFDLMATWTGEEPEKTSRSGKDWRQHNAVNGYACPEHARALWGDGQHVPNWHRIDDEPGRTTLRCACGWDSGRVRFRGHGIVLWQAHALEVLEANA